MQVRIKKFSVSMEIKTKGIELDIKDTKGTHIGDLYVTKTGLIWCNGQTTRKNGKSVTWKSFIEWIMKS